jgi:hypothetical protein
VKITPERAARVVEQLPPSRFPDRDMTPGEVYRNERMLQAGIEYEQQKAHQVLRYWTDPDYRQGKLDKARARASLRFPPRT